MTAKESLHQIAGICRRHETWRQETINLIASENVLSPAARRLLDTDFHHRYAEGHPGARYYEGTKFIDEIETETHKLILKIFGAARADVRLPSGTMANEAVFSALMKGGGVALAHGIAGGGHISHARIGALGKRADKILELPRLADGFRMDAAATRAKIAEHKPRLVVLGRSLFLFPEPVAEIREACDEVGATILFDGSHVLGLIAGGMFQSPLAEGADLMTASTHKTFFGPQRGIIVSREKGDDWWKPIDRAVFPGVTSNHHLFTLPSLWAASLEVVEFGAAYAQATIANAKALGQALHDRGFAVAAPDLGFTESHQIAIDVKDFGGGRDVSRKLSDNGIICNMNLLPGEDPRKNARNPQGLRIGVQEMTRFGMGPDEMGRIAEIFGACVKDGQNVTADAKALRDAFPTIGYGFSEADLSS